METQYLKTLLMAVEEGSFSKAALKLNITQSAVSQRTKNLEACCGVELLDRSGSVLQPTEAGRVVMKNARSILAEEEQMLQQLRSLNNKRHLHICCTPAFGMSHLPKILKTFVPAHDEIDNLTFLFQAPQEALDGLRSGDLDVAVVEHMVDLDFGMMRHMPLPKDEMVFVGAPGLGIVDWEVPLSELQQHCLIARRHGCSCRDLLTYNLDSVNSNIDTFKRVMVLDDFNLIVQEVLDGAGITFISRGAVEKHISDCRLQEYRVAGFQYWRHRSIVALECEGPGSLKRAFMESVFGYFDMSA